MKKITKKQTMISLFSKGTDGRLISVMQMETPDWIKIDDSNPDKILAMPIIVNGYGWQESLSSILDERERLKTEVSRLRSSREQTENDTLMRLREHVDALDEVVFRKKRWWQFWR